MKRNLLYLSLLILQSLSAIAGVTQENVTTNDLQMLASYGSTQLSPSKSIRLEGKSSYVDFEFNNPVSGEYYINFWINPYQNQKGVFPTYDVLLDSRRKGSITPIKSTPHSISPTVHKIFIPSGRHTISVKGVIPDIPEIEIMKISNLQSTSKISSSTYDKYVEAIKAIQSGTLSAREFLSQEKAKQRAKYPVIEEMKRTRPSGDFFPLIPVSYTFRTSRFYEKDAQVIISTQSDVPHVVYFFSEEINKTPLINQGLTWLHHSSVLPGAGDKNTALFSITIPKRGFYNVVVRTLNENSFGFVDVNLNQQGFYKDKPISFSYIPVSQPRNKRLLSMTITPKPDTDENLSFDPFLYVLGGGSCPGLVVQYNDDVSANSPEKEFYGLKRRDSFIDATYLMPTCGLLIANFSTFQPLFYCNVITNLEYSPLPPRKNKSKEEKTSPIIIKLTVGKESMTLQSQEVMNLIEVFSAKDMMLIGRKSLKTQGEITIPMSDLRISIPGIYIIRVTGSSGVVSQKIIL